MQNLRKFLQCPMDMEESPVLQAALLNSETGREQWSRGNKTSMD